MKNTHLFIPFLPALIILITYILFGLKYEKKERERPSKLNCLKNLDIKQEQKEEEMLSEYKVEDKVKPRKGLCKLFGFNDKSIKEEEMLSEYTASNGVNYKVGDKVKLSKELCKRLGFNDKSIKEGYGYRLLGMSTKTYLLLPKSKINPIVTIKAIKEYNSSFKNGIYFTVIDVNRVNHIIKIEQVISDREIE